MGNLKFAIIGCGAIFDSHAAAITAIKDAELAAICDKSAEALNIAGRRHPTASLYEDYIKMLDETDVDIVNIVTPPSSHSKIGMEAAKRGKHVIVEKPVDISLDAADKLIGECRRNGVKLGCIFQNRFNESITAAKKAINDGILGRLNFGGSYTRWWREQSYYDNRKSSGSLRADGGGALINQSVHTIDLLLNFMGPVSEVYGYIASRAHQDIGVEDVGAAALLFKSGALGIIEGSTGAYPGFCTRLDINGEDGTVIIEDSRIVTWKMKDGTPAPEIVESAVTPHQRQIADFIEAVRCGGEPAVNGEEARKALEVVLAIYESNRTGRRVMIG